MNDRLKKIESIELKNFKGYKVIEADDTIKMDVNADIVLITGKNGVGKTSLLQALDWVLNHPTEGGGGYLTTGKSSGAVILNGKNFEMSGKSSAKHSSLESVSSFFYQENTNQLACDATIQLLEPESKPAEEIRQSLKNFQVKLEAWQRKIHGLKYRKDYENIRKHLAGLVNIIVNKLPDDSEIKGIFREVTLTLNNGNLQSKWQSQIKSLASTIFKHFNEPEIIGGELAEHLAGISLLLKRKVAFEKSTPTENNSYFPNQEFISILRELPVNTKIIWPANHENKNENCIFVEYDKKIFIDELNFLEQRQKHLRDEYRVNSRSLSQLSGDGETLDDWLNSFRSNISVWLDPWEGHSHRSDITVLKDRLSKDIETLMNLSSARFAELTKEIERIEKEGKDTADSINSLRRAMDIADEISNHELYYSSFATNGEVLIGNLIERIESSHPLKVNKPQNDNENLSKLAESFETWALIELDKNEDDKKILNDHKIGLAEELIEGAIAICKQEAGPGSQLLSSIGTIPKVELQQLLKNMNELLGMFHFPPDFLPIEIENIGTEKKPLWNFVTNSRVPFESLSTGQKTQLAICWTVNLNLARSAEMSHSVIGFDDFTTSLDLNQLIPAAVLIRKLAYANETDQWKRQVFVTSHHEDLTNKLLDFLLPPSGSSMKVIQFEDWTVEKGPRFKTYEVQLGDEVKSLGLESAIRRVVN